MPGGLIQIVTYGSQDLYLTGTPEITFFKTVYRRHTNFSMESRKINFDDTVGFGTTSALTTPRFGDLIHKMYLEITIPEINFKRHIIKNDQSKNCINYKQAVDNLNIVKMFMNINRQAYAEAYDIYIASNTTNGNSIVTKVTDMFADGDNLTIDSNFDTLLSNMESTFTYDEISMKSIVNGIIPGTNKEEYFSAMTVCMNKSIKLQKKFYNDMLKKKELCDDEMNDNLKVAWVERLGHAIIEEIEIRIGGQKIDKHFGDWINIWYELSANRDMEPIYFKLIGNVSELTTFDRTIKPSYVLRIPLQFWFNRFSGLSIPLVALEYHNVTFHVKFRNIEEVLFIEQDTTIYASERCRNIFLDEVPDELGINISARMLIDYIFLDQAEREKFAQSSHEYLIQQLQQIEIRDINKNSLNTVLNNFVHPSIELIWVAQKERYTENIDGYTELRWNNYTVSDENKGNIIKSSTIHFHSHTRVPKLPGNYYNYVQPYESHNTTPSDGINMYSFAIDPEENQPSGSANLGRLSRILLSLDFDPVLFPEDEKPETIIVRIYTRSLNILRIYSGQAGCAFSYG
uniref:Major capsid protein n=1 Tax=Mimivirus LCMiAC01 TaxID=2506608 RepID=A0A481Z0Y8_9VIRU|nr:MAG: major capsid protein [Mimivirus LCMiAC01]